MSSPELIVTPLHTDQRYIESFTRSYITRDDAGDYQIVLLNDPIDRVPTEDAGKPLSPADVPPVRQVLHIRLLWRPLHGTTVDSPAASNAALHWYVLGTRTVEGTSIIHYAGTAFVSVSTDGAGATIIVKNGELHQVEQHGELVDPLKSFALEGKFEAASSDRNVRQILADVKSTVADSKALRSPGH